MPAAGVLFLAQLLGEATIWHENLPVAQIVVIKRTRAGRPLR